VTIRPTTTKDDFTIGQDLYWRGCSDSRCANRTQVEGWYAACEQDDRGRTAYLTAMLEADADGEDVDWDGVAEVVYNSYGDRVR
jgi:hypothetical protein